MRPLDRREFLKLSGAASLALTLGESLPTASLPSAQSPLLAEPWIEIDLDNMAWNLAQIRARVGNRPVMAVIKANAYGHGLVEVGKFLEKQKVEFLAVGKFQEALQLWKGGVRTPILNLGSFSQDEAEEIVRLGISQSVYSDDFKLLADAARKLHKTARVLLLACAMLPVAPACCPSRKPILIWCGRESCCTASILRCGNINHDGSACGRSCRGLN